MENHDNSPHKRQGKDKHYNSKKPLKILEGLRLAQLQMRQRCMSTISLVHSDEESLSHVKLAYSLPFQFQLSRL